MYVGKEICLKPYAETWLAHCNLYDTKHVKDMFMYLLFKN